MKTRIKVLGSGQDGGVPHAGCHCPACEGARANGALRRLAPSLAVYNEDAGFCYVMDASPHLEIQIEMIREAIPRVSRGGKIPVTGFLLTHAHIGHFTGLLLLRTEVLGEAGVPVYCTARMKEFLSLSRPFSLLVENGNIVLHEMRPNTEFNLDGVSFTPIPVPHRGEITDTVGYAIKAGRQAVYIPDTDRWTASTIEEISKADMALIDGSFYSKDELPGFEDVPHPPITETFPMLEGLDTEIYFTHINHTNPVHSEGPERKNLEQRGFNVAHDGLVLDI
jgi:pyrroloquinoline quinone biosynthesis protein B